MKHFTGERNRKTEKNKANSIKSISDNKTIQEEEDNRKYDPHKQINFHAVTTSVRFFKKKQEIILILGKNRHLTVSVMG